MKCCANRQVQQFELMVTAPQTGKKGPKSITFPFLAYGQTLLEPMICLVFSEKTQNKKQNYKAPSSQEAHKFGEWLAFILRNSDDRNPWLLDAMPGLSGMQLAGWGCLFVLGVPLVRAVLKQHHKGNQVFCFLSFVFFLVLGGGGWRGPPQKSCTCKGVCKANSGSGAQ